MNGRLMKMELDGNINNKENIGKISEKRLEEIKQKYPNFMQINSHQFRYKNIGGLRRTIYYYRH